MGIDITSGGLKKVAGENVIPEYDMVGPTIRGQIGTGLDSMSDLPGSDIASPIAGLLSGVAGGVPRMTSSMVSIGRGLKGLLDIPEANLPFVGKSLDQAGEGFLDLLQSAAEKITPEKLQEYLGGATGGYLTPTSPLSKRATETMQDVGSIIGTGGSPGTAALAVGGRETAKAFGFGPYVQAAAGVLTPGLASAWRSTGPTTLKKFAVETYKKEYPKAVKASRKFNFDATNVKKDLTSLISENTKNLKGKTDIAIINNNLKKIVKSTAPSGRNTVKANVKKMWDHKKSLNSLVGENISDGNKIAENIYKRAVGSVNSFLQKAGAAKPSFGKSFNLAEDLYKLSNLRGGILDAIKKSKDISSFLKSAPMLKTALLGGIYKYTGLKTAGLTAVGSRAFNLFSLAKDNPSLQKRLLQIADAATLGKFKELKGMLPLLDKELKGAVENQTVEITSGGLKK